MLRDYRLLLLLLIGSLTTMTGGVIAPVLPEIIQQLHLDPAVAANVVSIHCLTIAIFSPLLGILADKVGQLRVLVPSLIVYAVVGTAGGLIQSLFALLVSRAILGIASGGIAAASLGILGNMYAGKARTQALAYASSILTIAGIVFPLLGGWVGASNWRFTFGVYGVALPLAIIAGISLRQPSSVTISKSGYKLSQVLSDRRVIYLLLTLSVASITMYTVVIYAPLYFKASINASTLLNGIILAARAIGAAVASAFWARRLAQTFGAKKATAIGFILMAIAVALLPIQEQLQFILLTAILFGAGFGIVLPNLYSTLADLAPPKLRSSVLALGTGAGFLGQFLSPILFSPVLNYSGLSGVFLASACLSAVVGVSLLWSKN